MSYLITRLVRTVRMPATLKRKPVCKSILLSLADDAGDDGANAFTAVPTMSLEAAASARVIDACLIDLQRVKLIELTAPARQHRPKTWRLNMVALAMLADPHAVAKLDEADQQLVATLRAAGERLAESQHVAALDDSGSQDQESDPQDREPAPQNAATERLNGGDLNIRTPPRTAVLIRDPGRAGNYPVLFALAKELLKAGRWMCDGCEIPIQCEADLHNAVKDEARRLVIDYGDKVDFRVSARAAAAAWSLRETKRKLGIAKAS